MFQQKTFLNESKTRKCVLTRYTSRGQKKYAVGYYGEFNKVDDTKAFEVVDFNKLKSAKYSIERFLN